MQGPDEGIGALALHPGGSMFLLGGRHRTRAPSLGVYVWGRSAEALPRLAKALPGGAQRAFVNAAFNTSGFQLATLAGGPDHMLTIWDWQLGEPLLQCKSTAQEVGAKVQAASRCKCCPYGWELVCNGKRETLCDHFQSFSSLSQVLSLSWPRPHAHQVGLAAGETPPTKQPHWAGGRCHGPAVSCNRRRWQLSR